MVSIMEHTGWPAKGQLTKMQCLGGRDEPGGTNERSGIGAAGD